MNKSAIALQAQAVLELRRRGKLPDKIHPAEDLVEFSSSPVLFFEEVLGVSGDLMTDQMLEILDAIVSYDQVLIPSGNNLGKTFTMGGVVCWVMGCLGQIPDAITGRPAGAKVVLPGINHDAIFNTIYTSVISHLARAQSRGWNFPGTASNRSVHWHVRPGWNVEPMSPPKSVGGEVAHAASGRHHENLWIIVEEGAGVREDMWKAFEGMASGEGNKIISPLNPTEPSGPAWERSRKPGWVTVSLSALDHPNVVQRKTVIPGGAISHEKIDARVEAECDDMGPFPEILPNETHGDFVYRLPPSFEERVYRPSPKFRAQVLGQWAEGSSQRPLFTPMSWDAAVDLWKSHPRPQTPPDVVGIDLARMGGDEIMAAPMWGDPGPSILRDYREIRKNGDDVEEEEFLAKRRIYMGRLINIPAGEGPEVAERIHHLFPDSGIILDKGSVGASPFDHLRRVLNVDAMGISFGSKAPEPEPDEPFFSNLRAAMYWRFSRLVRYGLICLPPNPRMREEAMATDMIEVERATRRGKRGVVQIVKKEKIKRDIGRSPDSLESAILSCWESFNSRGAIILGG